MKYSIGLLLFLFIKLSTGVSAQDITKDTTSNKDTTIGQKLRTLVKFVTVDTVPRRETAKDTILEKKFDGKGYSFRQFEHETFLFAESPGKWHPKDWLRIGLVITLTVAIIPLDQYISNITQGHQSNYYIVPVILGRIYGAWYFNVAVTTAMVGYGILKHDTRAEKIDIELFQAGVYSALITEILKVSVGRSSPYTNLGTLDFHPFYGFQKKFQSMPNYDATSSFALSTITYRHANSTFAKILAYVPAALTLFADIYQNDHWASDEFIGAAIGFGTGMWVVTLHEGKRHKINLSTMY
ncbi:MAG TPA: phosphatase PAP2 family protein [Bacteroidia bacterium]|jgi:hypothetical protein|nr:phosphatase PAP2 family protein [Bacteroidia bacterium]